MKKMIFILMFVATYARAQWVVYDPALHTQQIMDQIQNMAQYVQMVENQVQQIQQLTAQLNELQKYNTAFGNPASLVNIPGANPLTSDLKRPVVGQSLVTIQVSSQGTEAMKFNAGGLYHSIGVTFQTPSGAEVQRQEEIYRPNAAVQKATLNYTNVYNDATQRRLALRANIAATVEKLQGAKTSSEVQKLTGVLIGLNADLADTDREVDQAASLALVQDAENRSDKDKQDKARLEEQQAEFSETLKNYRTAFKPVAEAPNFPTQ
jgi:hypothetical protein